LDNLNPSRFWTLYPEIASKNAVKLKLFFKEKFSARGFTGLQHVYFELVVAILKPFEVCEKTG
jgi:hypothetical protein